MNSKYNAKQVEFDGYKFDSQSECEFYKHLKSQLETLQIKSFKIHPTYELQPAFTKNGIKHRAIIYEADFEFVSKNDEIIVVDIKGLPTQAAILKKKMFDYRYANKLVWLTYVKKYGGWIEYDELKKLRKANKKESK